MTGAAYAVVWRDGDGPTCAGRLEIGADGIHLIGSSNAGIRRVHKVPFGAIAGIRIGRERNDRLSQRPALVLERADGSPLRITGTDGPSIIHELADLLAVAGR